MLVCYIGNMQTPGAADLGFVSTKALRVNLRWARKPLIRCSVNAFAAATLIACLFGAAAAETPPTMLMQRPVRSAPESTLQKIQKLVQTSPGKTNLAELEIYEPGTNVWDHIRPDVKRWCYYNEEGLDSSSWLVQVFQVPASNRFYIQYSRLDRGSQVLYYGPFEGDPFKVLAAEARRPAGEPLVTPALTAPGNPSGLDDDTIIRMFQTGKRLQSAATMAGSWAEAHHLQAPGSLDEVFASYINRDELVTDPLSGSKLRIVSADGKIRIYSVAPSGVWRFGVELVIGQREVTWLAEGANLDYLQGHETAHYLAKRNAQPEALPVRMEGGNLSFGPVTDGLSAALELLPTNSVFALDQPIEIRFHIRNEANYEIQIAGDSWRQGDEFFVEDEDGRRINTGRTYYSGWSPIERKVLKAGQEIVIKSSALEFLSPSGTASHPVGYTAHVKPGRYGVSFLLRFAGWNARLMDWQGTLVTEAVPVEIKAGLADTKAAPSQEAVTGGPLAYFSGRVLDEETGRPLGSFWVQMGWADRQHPDRLVWQESFHGSVVPRLENDGSDRGKFWADSYQGYAGGRVWARVLADGYLPQPVTKEPGVCPFRLENLEVRLKRGREVEGVARDSKGKPVAGARICLGGVEGLSEARQQLWLKGTVAISDADGHFTLSGAGGDWQRITAFSKEGAQAGPIPLPEPGRVAEIVFR